MRTEAEIRANANPRRPFSNHTEFDMWASGACYECQNDRPDEQVYCPIFGVAVADGVTPMEWKTREQKWQIGDASGSITVVDECTEFVERVDWPGDPEEPAEVVEPDPATVPVPVSDAQLDLFGGEA